MDGAQLCSWINTHVKFTETETIRQNAHVNRTNDKDYALSKNHFDSYDWYEWQALQSIGISLVNLLLAAQVAPTSAQWPEGRLQLINNWNWKPRKINMASATTGTNGTSDYTSDKKPVDSSTGITLWLYAST